MQVPPISPNSPPRNKFNSYTDYTPGFCAQNKILKSLCSHKSNIFKYLVKENGLKHFFNSAKTFFASKIAAVTGAISVPIIISENNSSSEKNSLYLNMQNCVVTPQSFYKLYDASPELARIIANSNRRVSDYEVYKLLDLASCSIDKQQYQAIECLLNAQYENASPVFDIMDINTQYLDKLDEETCKSIISNKEKLNAVFQNIGETENKGQDYIDTACLLDKVKDVSKEELILYYETLTNYDYASTLKWAQSTPETRNSFLEKLNNSEKLANYALLYYKPLEVSEELLKKFDLIIQYEQSGEDLDSLIKHPYLLLDNLYDAESIKHGISVLKSLPNKVFTLIKQTELAFIIVNYEALKKDRTTVMKADFKDYIWLAEQIGQIDKDWGHDIANADQLNYMPPLDTKTKESFRQNIPLINSIREQLCSLDKKELMHILFSSNAKANFEKANGLLNNNLDSIVTEIWLKCKNTNPVFIDSVQKYLSNKHNLFLYMFIPDVSKDTIIDNFFQISKIIPSIAKAPEKYINNTNEEYSDLEMCYIKKYLEYSVLNAEAAQAYFDVLPTDVQDKIFILRQSLDYDNYHFMSKLYNAVAVTDIEYVNMLLAKRLNKFSESLEVIKSLDYPSKYIINKLIRHAKNQDKNGDIIKLSGKQKRLIVDYIPIMNKSLGEELKLLIQKYSREIGSSDKTSNTIWNTGNDFILDLDGLLEEYSKIIFKKLGYDTKLQEKYKTSLAKWDRNLIHLLLTAHHKDNGELKLIFDLTTKGELKSYIMNPETPYGKSNKITEKVYKSLGINYDTWLKGIESETISCCGEAYTIGLIDRNEENMIFMGNYTSCCTALGEEKGDSIPNYLLNTAFNIISVRDNKGQIAATSRIFISTPSNKKPELIIDNIEISNKLRSKLNRDTSREFVQAIWNYINKFAQSLSDKHIPIYMSAKYPKITLPQRPEIYTKIKLAGESTKQELYINTLGDYVNTKDCFKCNLINVFNEH